MKISRITLQPRLFNLHQPQTNQPMENARFSDTSLIDKTESQENNLVTDLTLLFTHFSCYQVAH